MRADFPLTWVAQTPNTKTGNVPSAYVGSTIDECRESCQGCALLDTACYAWKGLTRASLTRIEARKRERPGEYTLEHALRYRKKSAKAARIGVMGDPSRVRPAEMRAALTTLRQAGLAPLVYTHFWRESYAQHLRQHAMASCEFLEDAVDAHGRGWSPALVLPWDFLQEIGPVLKLPQGKIVVCPAQTKTAVTCNDCRMCSKDHPVWKAQAKKPVAERMIGIGFVDHSHAARRERQRNTGGLQLPVFGREHLDVRPPRPLPVAKVRT